MKLKIHSFLFAFQKWYFQCPNVSNCFFKWSIIGFFFIHFRSFETKNTNFTTNYCEKCSFIIRRRDSNSRPSESPPLTPRPGLLSDLHVNETFRLETILWTNFQPNFTLCSFLTLLISCFNIFNKSLRCFLKRALHNFITEYFS